MDDDKAISHHGSGSVLMQQWFRSLAQVFAVALVCICCYASAHAAECANAGNDGVGGRDAFSAPNCDTNFRDEKLSCEGTRTAWGACPPKPMPHKRTKLLSFSDLSSYLWYSIPHPNDQLRKYDGPLYRGTPGSSREVNAMIGNSKNDAKGSQRLSACVHQIEMRNGGGLSVRDQAKLIRLQLDNCANQYILNAALEPSRKEDTRMEVSSERCTPPERLTAKIACQPLHIETSGLTNEYSVTTYLETSWGRMLQHVKESDARDPTVHNAEAGTTKYKGYMRRKRSFGPFGGLLGSIFNIMNAFNNIMNTVSSLSDLSNMSMKMPDFKQVMKDMQRQFKEQFQQMGQQFKEQFTRLPGDIKSSFADMKRTFTELGQNFNMKDQFTKFGDELKDMRENFNQFRQDLPDDIKDALDSLPQTITSLDTLGPLMPDMLGSLGNLEHLIPNIAGLPGRMENLEGLADNFGQQFGDTMQDIGNLPGMVGTDFVSGVRAGYNAFGNLPSTLNNSQNPFYSVANGVTSVITDPVMDIGNEMRSDHAAITSLSNRFNRSTVPTQIANTFTNASNVMGTIPNSALATGGMNNIANDLSSMNALNNSLNGGTLSRVLSPSSIQSMNQISSNMQRMQGLEAGLKGMRQQMLAGRSFGGSGSGGGGLSGASGIAKLDGYINNVSNYNNMMRSMNMQQLAGTMTNMGNIRNVMNNPASFGNFGNLANMSNMMNGMAGNLRGMTNMGSYANVLGNMQNSMLGSLDFMNQFNLNSLLGQLKVRKDSEVHPQLPEGTIIRNPLPSPQNLPEIKISQLAAFPYEEITDPSHPFSPRWHYYVNDRDGYSSYTTKYTPSDQESQKNSVFCAGERKDDTNTKENEVIKVDVLEFRRKKFDDGENKFYDGIYNRIYFNQYCYNNDYLQEDPCKFKVTAFGISVEYDLSCMQCFGMRKKRTNNPPCATNYLGKDHNMITTYIPDNDYFTVTVLAKNAYRAAMIASLAKAGKPSPLCTVAGLKCPAACTITNLYRKTPIDKLCSDLRAPYTPINKLKMRFGLRKEDEQDYNAGSTGSGGGGQQQKLQNELPSGVNDGLMHKDHFANRMPYPRLWDTGKSIQLNPSNTQDPRDQNGRYTSIVGVGVEAVLQQQNSGGSSGGSGGSGSSGGSGGTQQPEPRKDQRCLIGGWGKDAKSGAISVEQHDPSSSWTELKLYQARTLRDFGVNCLGRYERLFKPGAQEDHVLTLSGGTYFERSDSCRIEAGQVTEDNKMFNLLPRNIPKTWRGYAGDPGDGSNGDMDTFPNFPNMSAATSTGLDGAEQGDIIIMPEGTASSEAGKKGMPILSYVTTTNLGPDCQKQSGCFVVVLERNAGKWPDSCGNTDSWGIESTRTFYRPGTMPNTTKKRIDEIAPAGTNGYYSCEDNDLQSCELKNWGSVKRYSIRKESARGGNLNPISLPNGSNP